MDQQEPGISPNTQEELASGIVELKPLTIDQICLMEGVEKDQIPEKLNVYTQKELKSIEEKPHIVDTFENPYYDFLYSCFISTRNLSEDDPLYDFSKTLDSFETFLNAYAPNISVKVRSNLVQRMTGFVKDVVHPEELVYLGKPGTAGYELRKGYNRGGRGWIKLPNSEKRPEFTTREVIEEVIEISGEQPPQDYLFHASGSASLIGIERRKAILSSAIAKELGEDVLTGEHTGMGNGRLLNNIFTNKWSANPGYSITRWFDEYSVVFGISREKLANYHKNKGEDWEPWDWEGEGVIIGPEAPLEAVDFVYAQKEYLPKLKEWLAKNAPHAKAVSLEAYDLIRENERIKDGDDLFGRKPVEDWSALLK